MDWNAFNHCLPAIKLHTSRTQSMGNRPSYLPPPTITCQCLKLWWAKFLQTDVMYANSKIKRHDFIYNCDRTPIITLLYVQQTAFISKQVMFSYQLKLSQVESLQASQPVNNYWICHLKLMTKVLMLFFGTYIFFIPFMIIKSTCFINLGYYSIFIHNNYTQRQPLIPWNCPAFLGNRNVHKISMRCGIMVAM